MGRIQPATIASGSATSAAIPTGDDIVSTILMPAAWTSAVMTFQVSADNSTYEDLKDNTGTEVSITVAQGVATVLSADQSKALSSVPWFRLRSGTSASPVNQGADRAVNIGLM